jgi:hypothetical protein
MSAMAGKKYPLAHWRIQSISQLAELEIKPKREDKGN